MRRQERAGGSRAFQALRGRGSRSQAAGRPGAARPEVLRAAGEGALWPAAAAWSLQRWPRRRPQPPTGGGRPQPGSSCPFPRRLNSGREEKLCQGTSGKPKPSPHLFSCGRPPPASAGVGKVVVGKELPLEGVYICCQLRLNAHAVHGLTFMR